jgi:uncharacterized protein
MSLETAKAAVDFLISKSGENKKLELFFFGGEPLIRFDLIKDIVKYSNKQGKAYNKKFFFSVTTNGSLFTDEVLDFFFANNILIYISWDGDKDSISKVKGKAAYDKMLWSVTNLKKRGYHSGARIVVNPEDIRITDFIHHIKKVGFDNMIFSNVYGAGKWTQEKADKVYIEIADFFIEEIKQGRIFKEFSIIRDLLVRLGISTVFKAPCKFGQEKFAITIDGNVLPCHHPEIWEKNYCLGNVFEGKINEELRKILTFKREELIGCQDCFAKPLCFGTCPAHNYQFNQDLYIPYAYDCFWIKARYKAVYRIYNELYVKDKNLVLLRWAIKEKLWMNSAHWCRELTVDELDSIPKEKLRQIALRLKESELKKETGDKILSFLSDVKIDKDNLTINEPLPPCIFGSKWNEIQKRFNIPKPKFDFPKEDTAENKKLRKIYNYYTKNAKIPEKCKTCMNRLRNRCDYCYFGLDEQNI